MNRYIYLNENKLFWFTVNDKRASYINMKKNKLYIYLVINLISFVYIKV